MNAARVGIDVDAGLLPGEPMAEHTRRYWLTSEEWDEGSEKGQQALGDLIGKANYYALTLMNPQLVNWVRFEWVWL